MNTPASRQELAIAHVVHDAIRAWQIETDTPSPCAPWEQATDEQRESTVLSVQAAVDSVSPEQQHERWTAQRIAAGWTWGPVRDIQRRTNPALVPYADLPEDQKAKDRLVNAIVAALAPTEQEVPPCLAAC